MNTVIAPIGDVAPVDDAALPLEWAQWAEEPGKSIQFEENGVIVGRVHAIVVGRGEAWIEGIWVAPAKRRQGLGRGLVKAAEDLIRGYNVGVVRSAVPAHNTGALVMAERVGFNECARAVVQMLTVPKEAPAESDASGGEPTVRRASVVEAPASSALLASVMKPWRDLLPIGWRFRRIGLDLVRGLAKDGRVLVTQEPGGIAIAAGRDPTVLTALVGSSAQRRRLVQAGAAGTDANRVVVFAPDASSVSDLGVAVAAHLWCPDGLVIVEKTLVR
jgi:GNAT superfamily N-acetyltransferase